MLKPYPHLLESDVTRWGWSFGPVQLDFLIFVFTVTIGWLIWFIIAFGRGEHFCLGAAVARREGSIAFQERLRRTKSIRLATKNDVGAHAVVHPA